MEQQLCVFLINQQSLFFFSTIIRQMSCSRNNFIIGNAFLNIRRVL